MKKRPKIDRPAKDVEVVGEEFPSSPVPEIEALRMEMELKQLLAAGNQLENLIFHSTAHDLDTSRVRKKLLEVHTRICELESLLGFQKVSRSREEMRRLLG